MFVMVALAVMTKLQAANKRSDLILSGCHFTPFTAVHKLISLLGAGASRESRSRGTGRPEVDVMVPDRLVPPTKSPTIHFVIVLRKGFDPELTNESRLRLRPLTAYNSIKLFEFT